MKYIVILCIIAGLLGGIIGHMMPIIIPVEYNKLFSVAILAGIESVCNAFRSIIKEKFNSKIFVMNFFVNVIIVVLFVFIGDNLGLDLYYVVLLALGFKLLQDLDIVKLYLFNR
ncbi:small basic family protein [uncultured Megamonas sp.]|uniref:small basic family protein n=1 Tax=uncultured Megamonas sp. TaxID=286140 RepID=UPI0025DD87A7|nr:small basic family protein [uncultured Megamonas sp.]